MNDEKYYMKIANQLQDMTEKHLQRQLMLLNVKSFPWYCCVISQKENNINSLTKSTAYRNELIGSDFIYTLI